MAEVSIILHNFIRKRDIFTMNKHVWNQGRKLDLSSRYPSGRLLSINSAFRKTSFSCSMGSLDLPSEFNNTFFVNPNILSKSSPHHGFLDELNLHSTCSFASIVLISTFCSDFTVALKIYTLSLIISFWFHLLVMKSFRLFLKILASACQHIFYQINVICSWCCTCKQGQVCFSELPFKNFVFKESCEVHCSILISFWWCCAKCWQRNGSRFLPRFAMIPLV